MKEGRVVLTELRQADGHRKLRPSILLRQMSGYGDWLVCGLSSQLVQEICGFDEQITPADDDFTESGLKRASIIRLGYLQVVQLRDIAGELGAISEERLNRLVARLTRYLEDHPLEEDLMS